MKKKKSLIAIVALLLVVVVGATFAYFQSNSTFVNIFNTGTYRIVTTEVFESPSNWVPGQEIPKTITSTNEGTIPAAIRVSYTEQWIKNIDGVDTDITSQVDEGTAIINFDNTSDWTKVGNYYYYKYILEPNETTSSFIRNVTLNSNIGNITCLPSQDGLSQSCAATDIALGATYKLTITKETVQYDKYQELWNTNVDITEKPPLVQLSNSERDKDNLQVGDEICIYGPTTECFNFIRYDGDNIVMLAKYNLKVGNIYDINEGSFTMTGEYTSSDTGYGVQSSEAKGLVLNESSIGTVAFSGTRYWYDGSNLKSKYGSAWNTNNIYDTDYSDASGTNYSVAYYVENYKDTLETYGLTVQDARLLTYTEATTNVGCSSSSYNCPSGFMRNSTFWLGSANSSGYVWLSITSGLFFYYDYDNVNNTGVRPVIVISKNDI